MGVEEMGTMADFYVGIDNKAEWIGSIGCDGYPKAIPEAVLNSKAEQEYRRQVDRFLKERKCDCSHFPSDGWPWPWDSSKGTDCSYAFYDGSVWVCRGDLWQPITAFGLGLALGSRRFLVSHPVDFPKMKKVSCLKNES